VRRIEWILANKTKLTLSSRSLSKASRGKGPDLLSLLIGAQPCQVVRDDLYKVAGCLLSLRLCLEMDYSEVPCWRLNLETLQSRHDLLKGGLLTHMRQIEDCAN
jgi:hypothetical protein